MNPAPPVIRIFSGIPDALFSPRRLVKQRAFVALGSMTTSHVRRLREDSSAAVPLSTKGYAVLRNHVPREAIDAALRHIHLDLIRHGLDAETMGKWLWLADWFPHLKW